MKRGLFVLAHGSRAKEADEILEKVVDMIKSKPLEEFDAVGYGSMELSEPSFEEGIDQLVKEGVEEIIITPMFLFKGNHIKKDIPEDLEKIKEKHPNIKFIMGEHIGADRRIADIVIERGREALQSTL